jgi:hypothetical protein
MASPTLSPSDQALNAIASAAPPATINDVIARMQAIDAALANNDGLKWFNRLYLMVTQQVDLSPASGAWKDPDWLMALDVIFARYYFGAIRGYLAATGVPSSWSALFEARFRTGIDRIQFALAGMNAHINHDLPQALIDTDAARNIVPAPAGPQHTDYQGVNSLLATVMPAALNMLATDSLGVLAEDTGKIGRVLAFWDLVKARDLAWDFADHLRGLNGQVRQAALDAQDALTGALGRAILALT